jgi:NADH-quinone oxidoreductase subunit M
MSWPILSVTTFLPLVGALFIMMMRSDGEGREAQCALDRAVDHADHLRDLADHDLPVRPELAEFQFVEKRPWLAGTITYYMGVDGSHCRSSCSRPR